MAETHEIHFIKPKPSSEEIVELTSAYFDAKGSEYDDFDNATEKRDLFTAKVNELILSELNQLSSPINLLSIACGTGRREMEITESLDVECNLSAVEVSKEMCAIARKRGIDVYEGAWIDTPLPEDKKFDSALILSAFGHVPTEADRISFLKKIADHLVNSGTVFFDVLNLHDEDEWGSELKDVFESENLSEAGFSLGDVMYRKIGEPEVCFYHYFTANEVDNLLKASGFSLERLWFIGYGDKYGIVQENEKNGAIFVKARKMG